MEKIVDSARAFFAKFDKNTWGKIVAEGSEQATEAYISHNFGSWIAPLVYSDRWRKWIAFLLSHTSANARIMVVNAIAAVIEGVPVLSPTLRKAVSATIRGLSSGGEDWLRDNITEGDIEAKLGEVWKKEGGDKEYRKSVKEEGSWVTGTDAGTMLIHRTAVKCAAKERTGETEEDSPANIFDLYGHSRGFCPVCFPNQRAIDRALVPEEVERQMTPVVRSFIAQLPPSRMGHFAALYWYARIGMQTDHIARDPGADLPDDEMLLRATRNLGVMGTIKQIFEGGVPRVRYRDVMPGDRERVERTRRERLGCSGSIYQMLFGGPSTWELVRKDDRVPVKSDVDLIPELRDGYSYELEAAIRKLVQMGDPDEAKRITSMLKVNVTYEQALADPKQYIYPLIPALLAMGDSSIATRMEDKMDNLFSMPSLRKQWTRLVSGRPMSPFFRQALALVGVLVGGAGSLALALALSYFAFLLVVVCVSVPLYVYGVLNVYFFPLSADASWSIGWAVGDGVSPVPYLWKMMGGIAGGVVIRFLAPPIDDFLSIFRSERTGVAVEERPGFTGWVSYNLSATLRRVGILPEAQRKVTYVALVNQRDQVGRFRRIGITVLLIMLVGFAGALAVLLTKPEWQWIASLLVLMILPFVGIAADMMQLARNRIEESSFMGLTARKAVRALNKALYGAVALLAFIIVLSWVYDPIANTCSAVRTEVGLYYGKVRGWMGIKREKVIIIEDDEAVPRYCKIVLPEDKHLFPQCP